MQSKRSHGVGNTAARRGGGLYNRSTQSGGGLHRALWYFYRRRIYGAFRKRSRGSMHRSTHPAGRHEIARPPKACRPILHGSTTSWPAARLIASALHCGKRRSHTCAEREAVFCHYFVAWQILVAVRNCQFTLLYEMTIPRAHGEYISVTYYKCNWNK